MMLLVGNNSEKLKRKYRQTKEDFSIHCDFKAAVINLWPLGGTRNKLSHSPQCTYSIFWQTVAFLHTDM